MFPICAKILRGKSGRGRRTSARNRNYTWTRTSDSAEAEVVAKETFGNPGQRINAYRTSWGSRDQHCRLPRKQQELVRDSPKKCFRKKSSPIGTVDHIFKPLTNDQARAQNEERERVMTLSASLKWHQELRSAMRTCEVTVVLIMGYEYSCNR